MKTDFTHRTSKSKITNFSIGSPIDIDRVAENHGGRAVFLGMLGSVDIFNENLKEIEDSLLNTEKDKVKAAAEQILGMAGYLGASRVYYQTHFLIQCCN